MALTIAQLAGALRLGDGATNPVEPELGIVTRLLAVSTATVTAYAGTAAPVEVRDEAAIRIAGYLYDQPTAAAGVEFASALRSSGAAALLAPWRAIGGGLIGAAADAEDG